MWAIRKASLRIKSQPFSPVTIRALYAKFETASSSYTDHNTGFSEPPPHISDRSLTLKRFYSQPHGGQSSFVGKHSFSSKAGTKCSELISEADPSEYEDEDDDFVAEVPQNEQGLSIEEEVMENNLQRRRAISGLFSAIVDSSSMSVKEGLDKWLEEGNDLSRLEISLAMSEFRKRRMYLKALQLSKLLETQKKVEFGERDYTSRVDLIAKTDGLQKAENYIKNKIPESFRGVAVYNALLANCVLNTDTKKAEQVFNEIKNLKLPITTFACNQLLLLYKRTDRRKMADVVLLMEKENIKPSLLTYRFLIDAKGQSNDIAGMEQIVETVKAEGLEPDLAFQFVLARHYVNLGVKEKAKAVMKEMEGGNLNENRRVCSYLLSIYASVGSEYDVKRVWETCESDPSIRECMIAIDAFGKLKKVEEAEAVFDKLSRKLKQLYAMHYTSMLKVYEYNKMWTKGKNLVKRMDESGCGIGPGSLDGIVKFYLKAGEIEQVDSILDKGKGKPRFTTYMLILGVYAMRGDVNNAEKIFERMKLDGYGYVSRPRQYNSLLQAYVNAKVPAYGFRNRLKADDILPNKWMEDRLTQLDALKDNKVMTTYQYGL